MLRTRTLPLSVGLGVAAALVAAAPATANRGGVQAVKSRTVAYAFSGKLAQTPAAGATQLSVRVGHVSGPRGRRHGTHRGLQSFAIDPSTKVNVWQRTTPRAGALADLVAGDKVVVHVVVPRLSGPSRVHTTPAKAVGDRTDFVRPAGQLFFYVGQLQTVDTAASKVTLRVRFANRPGLRTLRGAPASVTFAYAPTTTFITWTGWSPTTGGPELLKVGDRTRVRVFAPAGSSLAQVTATPATIIARNEPASQTDDPGSDGSPATGDAPTG